jgi:hypothetical protein
MLCFLCYFSLRTNFFLSQVVVWTRIRLSFPSKTREQSLALLSYALLDTHSGMRQDSLDGGSDHHRIFTRMRQRKKRRINVKFPLKLLTHDPIVRGVPDRALLSYGMGKCVGLHTNMKGLIISSAHFSHACYNIAEADWPRGLTNVRCQQLSAASFAPISVQLQI